MENIGLFVSLELLLFRLGNRVHYLLRKLVAVVGADCLALLFLAYSFFFRLNLWLCFGRWLGLGRLLLCFGLGFSLNRLLLDLWGRLGFGFC